MSVRSQQPAATFLLPGRNSWVRRQAKQPWVARLMLIACLSGAWGTPGVHAAVNSAEQLSFDAAIRDFDLGQWDRAARNLEAFETRFPKSELKKEATQRRQYAVAEAAYLRGDWAMAAKGFGEYVQQYPENPQALSAHLRWAQTLMRQGNSLGALQILESDGPFSRQLANNAKSPTLFQGLLIQSEALGSVRRWTDAISALQRAETMTQTAAEKAARWEMLAQIAENAGNFVQAAEAAENWYQALGPESPPGRRAEATAWAGRLWMRAGKQDRAQSAFVRNTDVGIPVEFQREATLQLADISLAQGQWTAARDRLQNFLSSQPKDSSNTNIRLRLGQTLFQQFLAAGGPTNSSPETLGLLALSQNQFTEGLGHASAKDPTTAGPLHLGLAWTLWQEGSSANLTDKLREAGVHFLAAAELLPSGADQATARFKLADIQLRLDQPAAALTNLLVVLTRYPQVPEVQNQLLTPALLQTAQAGVAAGNLEEAARAVDQLMSRNVSPADAGSGLLWVGQALARKGEPDRAKSLLNRFLSTHSNTPVSVDVELALATVDIRAQQWTNALVALDRWIERHTNHALLPQAEFDRAWALAQAGLMTNAVERFSELQVKFPVHPIAQTASLWLASHYFSQGDFARAEKICVGVYTNTAWKGNLLWHQARIWAADAARRRQSFGSAREQLVELLNDRTTPTDLVPSAYFALGEIHLEQPPSTEATVLDGFQQALEAFTAAAQYTNSMVSLAALGKMADCHLQLATRATNSYAKADELYLRVLESPRADISARCKASMGRGLVAEKLAAGYSSSVSAPLIAAALDRYLDVVNGALVLPGEQPDPWWLKEAGREAGRLLESAGRWKEAATLYERLARELPSLKSAWELRASEARKKASG